MLDAVVLICSAAPPVASAPVRRCRGLLETRVIRIERTLKAILCVGCGLNNVNRRGASCPACAENCRAWGEHCSSAGTAMIVTPLVARPLARLKPEGEPCGQASRCALHGPFKPYNVEPAWHFTTPPEARVLVHQKGTCDVAH